MMRQPIGRSETRPCGARTTTSPSTRSRQKEMIVDYRKRRPTHAPILINGAVVEQVESFKFLGVHITNKLTWSKHTKTVGKRA